MPAVAPPSDATSPRQAQVSLTQAPGQHLYGGEQSVLAQLPGHARELAPGLTEAMVRFAVRYEMARTVEDVLARRSRLLFLDAQAAQTVAPVVAALLQEEGCEHVALEDFQSLAKSYLLN
jgi:glycerol-3-phosphate dehydrogenase